MNPKVLMSVMAIASLGLALDPWTPAPITLDERRGERFRERVRQVGPLPISMLACAETPKARPIPAAELPIVEAAIARREAKAAKRALAIAASRKVTPSEGASV